LQGTQKYIKQKQPMRARNLIEKVSTTESESQKVRPMIITESQVREYYNDMMRVLRITHAMAPPIEWPIRK
jgi:hypothetical protein